MADQCNIQTIERVQTMGYVVVSPYEIDCLVGWAFRYGLGRRSYAVGMIADAVIRHRRHLEPQTRDRLIAEIDEAIARGEAGMDCDVRNWQRVRAALTEDTPRD